MKGFSVKSKGTPVSTEVFYDGVKLEGVVGITIAPIRYDSGLVKATIEVYVEELNVELPWVVAEEEETIQNELDGDTLKVTLKGEVK